MNPGVVYAVLAFAVWGLFPLYLKPIAHVPPLEVVLHRSAWSLVFLLGVLTVMRRWRWLAELAAQPRRLLLPALCAVLLSFNWLLYVYAIQAHRVVESSLGYFINPLFNVLLAVAFLKERLRAAEWLAVALAAVGVAWLTWHTGRLPWLALALGLSFAIYGILRKTSSLGAVEGLTLETLLLAPLVLPALIWMSSQRLQVQAVSPAEWGWLILGGPLTALPLMWFAAGARRLRLATVGLLQYMSPTLQLLVGVTFFEEKFGSEQAVCFAFIWAGLAVYSGQAVLQARSRQG